MISSSPPLDTLLENEGGGCPLIGRRDVIAHGLLTVDDERVYREAERDFGLLVELISRVYFVPIKTDFGASERAELSEEGRSVEEVARQLEGMPIWGHPRTQINVVPPPSIPSVIWSLLPAIYNPNLPSHTAAGTGGRP